MLKYPFHGTPILTNSYRPPYHYGEDYALANRTAIVARSDGIVDSINGNEKRQWIANTPSDPYKIVILGKIIPRKLKTEDYGNYVKIFMGTLPNGGKVHTLDAHLDEVVVYPGQVVKEGELIGYSDSKGNSTGGHVHTEIRVNNVVVDPNKFDYSFKGVFIPQPVIHKLSNPIKATVTTRFGLNVRKHPATVFDKEKVLPYRAIVEVVGYVEGELIDKNNIWLQIKEGSFIWIGGTDVTTEALRGGVEKEMLKPEYEAKKAELEAIRVTLEARKADLATKSTELENLKVELDKEVKSYEDEVTVLEAQTIEEPAPEVIAEPEPTPEPVVEEPKVEEVVAEPAVETVVEPVVGYVIKDDYPSDVKSSIKLINELIAKYADYLK